MKLRHGLMQGMWLVGALAFSGMGCGSKGGDAPAQAKPKAEEEAPKRNHPVTVAAPSEADIAAAVAAVQAKVPAGVDVTFEAVTRADGRYIAIMPRGWNPGLAAGEVAPPADSPLFKRADDGTKTEFWMRDRCEASTCDAQRDRRADDRMTLMPYSLGSWKLNTDERLADGLIAVAAQDGQVAIAATRWYDDAPAYFECHASLVGPEAVKLAPAFEEACRRFIVTRW